MFFFEVRSDHCACQVCKLVDITTEEYSTFESNHIKDSNAYDIDLNVSYSINADKNTVAIFTKFDFSQQSNTVLHLLNGCNFKIDEEYWSQIVNENIITLSKELLTHLIVLSVGTSRGVIHAKRPKWLHDLLLPTINVTSLVDGDMQFDLTKE